MIITNIHEAKTNLSLLLRKVTEGKEIIIGKAGKPIAKLVKYTPSPKPRCPGQWRGKVHMSDDFDELPESILAAFRGENP